MRRPPGDELRISGLAAACPRANPSRPTVQCRLGIPTRVQLLVAVQAQVHEVAGDVLEIWPFARRVGHHERDVVPTQLRDELGRGETRVANLDRVAQRPLRIDLQTGAAVHAALALTSRVSTPAEVSRGNSARKLSNSFASYRSEGGNCHSIGPNFSRRLNTPEAKKFASGLRTFFNRRMCVMYRGPLTLNTKSAGVARRQVS